LTVNGSLVFDTRRVMPAAGWMCVAKRTVIVPNRPVITWIALEKKLWRMEYARSDLPTEWTGRRLTCFFDRPLDVELFGTRAAPVSVTSHTPTLFPLSGRDRTRSAAAAGSSARLLLA